jgi:hypothetical protein
MRPEAEYQGALELIAAGINDSEIGRRLGIPRATIRDWRVGMRAGNGGRTESWSGKRKAGSCFRCNGGWLDEQAYAYLLGEYLGDGCLSAYPRDVFRLRISCDVKYPDIINEIATHIVIVRGVDSVGFTKLKGCIEVSASWKHWPCVFPQHAPGKKHQRKIELAPWQREITFALPKGIDPGPDPFGWQPTHQPDNEKAPVRRQALSIHQIHVHERIHRHPGGLHRCPRGSRSPLDADDPPGCSRLPPERRRLPRYLCWS